MIILLDDVVTELFGDLLKEEKVDYQLVLLKQHHIETYLHSLRVGAGCLVLGKELLGSDLGNSTIFDDYCLRACGYSGLLHDVGKLRLPASLLCNKDELTLEERRLVERHPSFGYDMLQDFDELVKSTVIAHHEYQKRPYPRNDSANKQKDNYSIDRRKCDVRLGAVAQVLAVSDNLDVMLHGRPYSPALPESEIEGVLRENFLGDPKYVELALSSLSRGFSKSLMDDFISSFCTQSGA